MMSVLIFFYKHTESLEAWGCSTLVKTIGRMDAAYEPTWMYSRRVLARVEQAHAHTAGFRKLVSFVFLIGLFFLSLNNAWATHCSVSSQSVAFGEYDVFYPGPLDGMGAVLLQCDSSEPFRVSLDPGLNSGGNYLYRQLSSADTSQALLYNLYLDSSRSLIWGDGSSGTDVYSGSTGSTLTLPIYGRIPPAQRMSPGFYSDAVLITVEW